MKRGGWFVIVGVVAALLWWLSSRTGEVGLGEAGGVASPPRVTVGERVGTPQALRVAQRASMAGHVRDEQGRGVPGASVCASGFSRVLDRRDAEDLRCVQSEADGGYRIDGLWPVAYFVRASAPRFVPGQHRRGARTRTLVTLRAGQEARDIDVVLRSGGVELRGVVHDLSGGVLEGAQVSAGDADARSGPEGTFSMWVAPGQVYVTGRAAGYAEGSQPGVAPGQWFELRLTPESVLVGRVVRAGDRAPLAGASVYAQASDAWNRVGPAISDDAGNFRIEGLLPGTYKLEAMHDEAYGMAAESAVLGLGETSEAIEITAHPAYLVEGTVVRAGGEPCEGGYVRLTEAGGSGRSSGIEPDGNVHVQGVLPGTYGVKLECDGAVSLPEYPSVMVTDRALRGLRWDVQRGQAIRGEVVLADGTGVGDVGMQAEPQNDPQAPRAHTTDQVRAQTLGDGRFELAGLLPGRYRVRAGSDEYPSVEAAEVVVREGQDVEGVRIALRATGELRGTVKDGAGEPVKRVEVHVQGTDSSRTRTADDGSFRFAHLAAGAYRVTARDDHRPLRAPGATEDPEGVAAEVVVGVVREVQVVVESQRGRITGRVVDSAGGPLLDAFVEPAREGDGPAMPGVLQGARQSAFFGEVGGRRLTDQDGRFELGGIGAGKYTLLARRRGGGEGTREHVVAGEDVEIRIAEPASLEGRVRLAGGDVPEQFTVEVYAAATSSRVRDRFFRTAGMFRFPELPAGEYTLTIEAPDGAGTGKASLAEGERAQVQVELGARVTVRGRLIDVETGEGVPGMLVRMTPRGQQRVYTSEEPMAAGEVTDVQGRFELAKVNTGAVQVMIVPRGMVDNGYEFTGFGLEVAGPGPVVELAPMKLTRLRIKDGEQAGDLGLTTGKELMVTGVRAGGPAARAGVVVGDQVVRVDGHPVTGDETRLFYSLSRVPAGTRLVLGLARGVDVEVVAGVPR